ncbi:D-cysteine desulfhydrase family protein [Spongiibacter sp. KMU-158]|uniref:D-cysteine desulfhydrase family protein n=1 Tax=Spongiibacter pelagi TaxID=2760804 RepID=A0A927GWK8_9GAMM|nr:D-cysteine desulfhydrase family protein [Spongiibacter pelagi]MBD2859218.1 D-cysteine desulfhydrase family protein [Spongiibacter pelagi]
MPVNPQFCHPPRLQLAQTPTPLQCLERLSAATPGPRIWVKRDDLTGSVLSGNKVRKLEFSLAKALQEGCDTVITCGGLQSNHCRATALLCAQLGLKCHLVLRGEPIPPADGNFLLDQLAGASISCYPAAQYQNDLENLLQTQADAYLAQGHKAFIIPTGASDATGVWGYFNAAKEIAADCRRAGIQPKHIICATGSGGTQAGLTAGAFYFLNQTQVWGINVCDDEDWFLIKVASDLADWQALYDLDCNVSAYRAKVIDGYVGPGYALADEAIYRTIADVVKTEGLVLDPVYTGKAFHGLLQERAAGRFGEQGDIVFVHTGGVFGLFPHRQNFEFLA